MQKIHWHSAGDKEARIGACQTRDNQFSGGALSCPTWWSKAHTPLRNGDAERLVVPAQRSRQSRLPRLVSDYVARCHLGRSTNQGGHTLFDPVRRQAVGFFGLRLGVENADGRPHIRSGLNGVVSDKARRLANESDELFLDLPGQLGRSIGFVTSDADIHIGFLSSFGCSSYVSCERRPE